MNTKQKDFLTIEQIIQNIKDKNILIKDENKLKEILEFNNYYYITGYKEPFKILDKYKENIYFEDIFLLYQFDKKLKLIFAEILFEIEQKVKTVFTNNFCNRFGYKDIDLVNPNNYDPKSPYLLKCLNKLSDQIQWYGKESMAVSYYQSKYSYVPVWVLIKVLTFGMVRDLILNSNSATKGYITKKIVNDKNLKVNEVKNMLEMLIHLRNICCHDDKLYGFIHRKVHIMDTEYHKHFQLNKNQKGEYLQGKKDLFAAIICIKYFIDKDTYNKFINSIEILIDEYSNRIEGITKSELLNYMFLPENFTEIKDL